ncbi:MAG: DUF4347 domain-containing protein [Candidatus Obscuribacter sp.]|nr:DUF4347 domain-containing protein [Candidatus Obscuribacter sp.]
MSEVDFANEREVQQRHPESPFGVSDWQDNCASLRLGGSTGQVELPSLTIVGSSKVGKPVRLQAGDDDLASDVGDFLSGLDRSHHNIGDSNSLEEGIDEVIKYARDNDLRIPHVKLITHGGPGKFFFNDTVFNVDDPEVVKQLRRLKPYLTNDATISFHGCSTGQGAEARLQRLANQVGVRIVAYKEQQSAVSKPLGAAVVAEPKSHRSSH